MSSPYDSVGGFPFEFLSTFDFRRSFLNGILVTHYCIFVSAFKIHKDIGEGQWLSMEVLYIYIVYQNNISENSRGKETLSNIYDLAKALM